MRRAGWMLMMLYALAIEARAEPMWIVDPTVVGANAPPAGHSLFDEVMADGKGGHNLPFPFEALIKHIEKRAGCTVREPCTHAVLIPLGRSLQRISATPEFFKFPRVVVAVTQEASGGVFLKDRLYLGYQEKANLIEAISYNDTAGRFEFQLVKNYRAGAAPQVVYANRTVCIACHQNHAPIFSRQVWDETHANPAIRARLIQSRSDFYGIPLARGIQVPAAIDAAVTRANELAVTRALWEMGCGDSDACRRGALISALRYRLSGERAIDEGNAEFVRDVVSLLSMNGGRYWRDGVALPNAAIPNRDPLQHTVSDLGLALSHVRAGLEPLLPRPPADVLAPEGAVLARRLVLGVAAELSRRDLSHITQALLAIKDAPIRTLSAPCRVTRRRLHCEGPSLALVARLETGRTALEWLQVPGAPRLQHYVMRTRGGATLTMTPDAEALRLANGNVVTQIVFDAKRQTARLSVREDFTRWLTRVKTTPRVLTRAAVRSALHLPAMTEVQVPAARQESDLGVTDDTPEHRLFHQHCAACHRGAETVPPNFLRGDAQRVRAALRHCAPRIYARLTMGLLPHSARAKTPMPPVRAARAGAPAQIHLPADRVNDLLRAAETLLRAESNAIPDLDHMLRNGYESTRACLPPEPS